MKLISAKFQNFRLLRDLRLDFSTRDDKKLTVIRASNESGKTTILNALQWVFYGNDTLPDKGKGYRLFPIDLDVPPGSAIPISVQADFETAPSELNQNKTSRYRLIRSVEETTDGRKQNPEVELFELTETGADRISEPEARIAQLLPSNLREVFFTDGDRALIFIEADSLTDKRNRVQDAIRLLLGLDIIDSAQEHLKKTIAKLNRESKNIGHDTELNETVTKLEEIDQYVERLEAERDDAAQQCDATDQKLAKIDRDIESVLLKGDQEALNCKLKKAGAELVDIRNQEKKLVSEHSQLFRKPALFRDLLAPVLEQSFEKLNELRDQGKLPLQTIPVLAERLAGVTCICGESLDQHSGDGKRRREHIERLITESQGADELQKWLNVLYYYGSLTLNPKKGTDEEHWRTEYNSISMEHDQLKEERMKLEKELASLEVQLESIGDTDIQKLREFKQDYTSQRNRLNDTRIEHEKELERLKEKRGSLTATHKNLISRQRRGRRILARLEAAHDISDILQNAYDRITNEELQKVSRLMNTFFLEMIGADPEQGKIIQRAEISEEFDILVYGPNARSLNPDKDLNGASRRALTIAFILALTKVSEVAAPNVIDTPLGMMDGFVKRSVLKTAIQESLQLILFLTRSEIKDCEDVIGNEAGCMITLTNSAHYPNILVNDPHIKEPQILRCECRDLGECRICKRRTDVEVETQSES